MLGAARYRICSLGRFSCIGGSASSSNSKSSSSSFPSLARFSGLRISVSGESRNLLPLASRSFASETQKAEAAFGKMSDPNTVGMKRGGSSRNWDRRKSNKRHRVNPWEQNDGPSRPEREESPDPRYVGLKKRKVAIFVAYSGTGYFGLQIQIDSPSIEGQLLLACLKANAIRESNASHSTRFALQRTARTDKNVHAGGNVVQMKLLVDESAFPDDQQGALDALKDRINEHLPEDITVLRIVAVGKGFHSKNSCSSRSYDYVFPTAALDPEALPDELLAQLEWDEPNEEDARAQRKAARLERKLAEQKAMAQRVEAQREAARQLAALQEGAEGSPESSAADSGAADSEDVEMKEDAEAPEEAKAGAKKLSMGFETVYDLSPAERTVGADPVPQEGEALGRVREVLGRFRLSEAARSRLDEQLSHFVGRLNYFNFTTGRKFNDPSCMRNILSFRTAEVFEHKGVEFVRVNVHGHSFMLNQIRRMVGFVIHSHRGRLAQAQIDELWATAFGKTRVLVPRAPGLGLLLDRCFFDEYDARTQSLIEQKKAANARGKTNGGRVVERSAINNVYEGLEAERELFKHRFIYSQICDREADNLCLLYWLKQQVEESRLVGSPVEREPWASLPRRAIGRNVREHTSARALDDFQISLPLLTMDLSHSRAFSGRNPAAEDQLLVESISSGLRVQLLELADEQGQERFGRACQAGELAYFTRPEVQAVGATGSRLPPDENTSGALVVAHSCVTPVLEVDLAAYARPGGRDPELLREDLEAARLRINRGWTQAWDAHRAAEQQARAAAAAEGREPAPSVLSPVPEGLRSLKMLVLRLGPHASCVSFPEAAFGERPAAGSARGWTCDEVYRRHGERIHAEALVLGGSHGLAQPVQDDLGELARDPELYPGLPRALDVVQRLIAEGRVHMIATSEFSPARLAALLQRDLSVSANFLPYSPLTRSWERILLWAAFQNTQMSPVHRVPTVARFSPDIWKLLTEVDRFRAPGAKGASKNEDLADDDEEEEDPEAPQRGDRRRGPSLPQFANELVRGAGLYSEKRLPGQDVHQGEALVSALVRLKQLADAEETTLPAMCVAYLAAQPPIAAVAVPPASRQELARVLEIQNTHAGAKLCATVSRVSSATIGLEELLPAPAPESAEPAPAESAPEGEPAASQQ